MKDFCCVRSFSPLLFARYLRRSFYFLIRYFFFLFESLRKSFVLSFSCLVTAAQFVRKAYNFDDRNERKSAMLISGLFFVSASLFECNAGLTIWQDQNGGGWTETRDRLNRRQPFNLTKKFFPRVTLPSLFQRSAYKILIDMHKNNIDNRFDCVFSIAAFQICIKFFMLIDCYHKMIQLIFSLNT